MKYFLQVFCTTLAQTTNSSDSIAP